MTSIFGAANTSDGYESIYLRCNSSEIQGDLTMNWAPAIRLKFLTPPGGRTDIGRDPSVVTHLRDGEEFSSPVAILLSRGEKLFKANWTREGADGRPLTKGTGRPLGSVASSDWHTIAGTLGAQLQLTGGIKGQITLPASVAKASIGGTIGGSCGVVGTVTTAGIEGQANCGHNGLVVSATVQLVNGLIEATGNIVLIQPSTPAGVAITIPFTL